MNDLQRLKEMGIAVWELRRPDIYPNLYREIISLPLSCKLLLICDELSNEHDAWLFGKILASIGLLPDQALRLPPAALPHVGEHALSWCWFAGVKESDLSNLKGVKRLISPALSVLHGSPTEKKALWLQIRENES
ncbi:DNA polymerase III subunit psi [Candidatus Enterovibrio escicola]|uniref:DNA polymerase III subunit psi n=1 Tax=Candidatus Enterovibrio escicola TaxID=1927127 RepID=A0A2A5T5S9_9GAMM|nr:DNA polymerase III subunit psi [Candidatus Enterovibrio escacola]PCS23535.1 DNA polymerase III psi subunit [Candidatus Enterovibrio escacola]